MTPSQSVSYLPTNNVWQNTEDKVHGRTECLPALRQKDWLGRQSKIRFSQSSLLHNGTLLHFYMVYLYFILKS